MFNINFMEQITTHTKQIEQLNEIKIVGITTTTMNKPNELMLYDENEKSNNKKWKNDDDDD